MRLTTVNPVTDAGWDELVRSRPTQLFHSRDWLGVLATTYGFPIRAKVIVDDQPIAGLPYAAIDDFMDRRTRILPFSDFCDPIAADARQWRTLVDELVAAGQRIDLRCLHNTLPVGDDRFVVTDRALWHAIDIVRTDDELWADIPGSARRALRRAHAAGVAVRLAEDEADLRSFFELHLGVRKYKYRLLAQPYAFFKNIWDTFLTRDHGALLLATIEQQVVAGVLFIEWQDTLYYKFNASDGAHLDARPNDMLLWEGISYARGRGLERIDLGLTDADQAGLIRYKRKYASEEKPVLTLRHEPAGEPSRQDQEARRMLRDITRLLTDDAVPDDLSERAGDALYRYFI